MIPMDQMSQQSYAKKHVTIALYVLAHVLRVRHARAWA